MGVLVDEYDAGGGKAGPEKYKDFREIFAESAKHPNQNYFVLKAIVNNLYGVDIMEEAVEICKLRLFLKLVAQVERLTAIEPLPDINFTIRGVNTLVGYALRGRRKAVGSKLDFGGAMAKIEDKAKILDSAAEMFREFPASARDVDRPRLLSSWSRGGATDREPQEHSTDCGRDRTTTPSVGAVS